MWSPGNSDERSNEGTRVVPAQHETAYHGTTAPFNLIFGCIFCLAYRRGCQEKEDVADEWVGYLLKTDVYVYTVNEGVWTSILRLYFYRNAIKPKVASNRLE